MDAGTIAAGTALDFIEFAVSKGATRKTLLSNAGLTMVDFADQDARVPLATYMALMRDAAAQTDDPALPLRVHPETSTEKFSLVELIIHSSISMPDAMEQLNRYANLMAEVDVMKGAQRFSVAPESGNIWIIDNRPNPNTFPELTEISFGWFIGEFRRHFSGRPFAVQIEVTHPRPAHAQCYDEIFQVPTKFGTSRNAIKIDPNWPTSDFVADPSYMFGVYASQADALMKNLEADVAMRGRTEAYILKNLHRGDMRIEDVAANLGISRQAINRGLRNEGATFAKIHNQLRHRMATDYISTHKASINQTAYLVGFSEPSSFAQAFRRWAGKTPAEYQISTG